MKKVFKRTNKTLLKDDLRDIVNTLADVAEGKEPKTEIGFMQASIATLTESSAKLEALEQRNKKLVESRIAESRQSIKQSKIGSQAAMQYYQKMNRINTVDPQLMDKKS